MEERAAGWSMRRRHLLAVLATAAILYFAWRLLGGSDETRIRRSLEDLARTASKAGDEPTLVAVAKAAELSHHFTDSAKAADARTGDVIEGREAIARAIAQARESVASGTVALGDVQVVVNGPEKASTTLVVSVRTGDARPSEYDGMRVSLTWAKVGRHWLIDSVFVQRAPAPAGSSGASP